MASFIDDVLGKLFPKKGKGLNVKENFVQTDVEKESIVDWMSSPEGKNTFALIAKNYHFKTSGMNSLPEVHILKSPYANGFAVSFDEPLTKETFSKLFFAIGRRIVDLGYSRVSLDRKIEEVNDKVRTTEKQYYKPPLSNADFSKKIDQIYGNVSVEKVSINDTPSYLKVLVTVYSDHLYKDAGSFDEFIDNLFESKN